MGAPLNDATTRVRVLIVDDNDILSTVLERILAPIATSVRASGVSEATSVLDRATFDVILCDYTLDDGDGAFLLRVAREKQPAALRLMMSGGLVPDAEALVAEATAEAVLDKPFSRTTFEEAIARVRADRA